MVFDLELLESLYRQFNRREHVHPDPLEFLYAYPDVRDREIAGLVASSLAYGNVRQILNSVGFVLKQLTSSPRSFLQEATFADLKKRLDGFKHRWHTGDDLSALLTGIKSIIEEHGSLESCFSAGVQKKEDDLTGALAFFVNQLIAHAPSMKQNLLPRPENGSACKRLWMYLRWMIRSDDVDPGGWSRFSPSQLLIPLDTHMFRVARMFRMTRRDQANLKTAQEVTRKFKKIIPEDPVRYDFVLTRPGIWKKKGLLSINHQSWRPE